MPNYRRARVPGGTYFFTLVSHSRAPVFSDAAVRAALRNAIGQCRARWPFTIEAWVLLPDHLHCIWTLPEGDAEFSRRGSLIKRLTTQALGRSIWQPRFWEHVIRDDRDWRRHIDYIHANPARHGLVERAGEWPYSTFHRYVIAGAYPPDWCDMDPDMDLE